MGITEGRCRKCGETVVNADPGDPHFLREDETECGGEIEHMGKWVI